MPYFNNATIEQVDAFIDFLSPQWDEIFISTATTCALDFEKLASEYYEFEAGCFGDVQKLALLPAQVVPEHLRSKRKDWMADFRHELFLFCREKDQPLFSLACCTNMSQFIGSAVYHAGDPTTCLESSMSSPRAQTLQFGLWNTCLVNLK